GAVGYGVLADARKELVVAGVAVECIVTSEADQRVVAEAAMKPVGPTVSGDRVGPGGTVDDFDPLAGREVQTQYSCLHHLGAGLYEAHRDAVREVGEVEAVLVAAVGLGDLVRAQCAGRAREPVVVVVGPAAQVVVAAAAFQGVAARPTGEQ